MGQWYAGGGGGRAGGGYPRHYLDGYAGFDQGQSLLPAATKQIGVATLQATDRETLLPQFNQAAVNAFLGCRAVSPPLAHIFKLGVPAGQAEDFGADQFVEQHHVGFLQSLQPLQGQQ